MFVLHAYRSKANFKNVPIDMKKENLLLTHSRVASSEGGQT